MYSFAVKMLNLHTGATVTSLRPFVEPACPGHLWYFQCKRGQTGRGTWAVLDILNTPQTTKKPTGKGKQRNCLILNVFMEITVKSYKFLYYKDISS